MIDTASISKEQAVEALRRHGIDVKKLERVRGAARMHLKKLEPVSPIGNSVVGLFEIAIS
jgi:hypothetical protein